MKFENKENEVIDFVEITNMLLSSLTHLNLKKNCTKIIILFPRGSFRAVTST